MKIFNGTDIIEIFRIKDNIEKYQDKFLDRIYTENEKKYCETKKKAKYESYAARFAAKEAIYKAISTKLKRNISWTDIEVVNNDIGKPNVFLNFEVENLEYIEISLSHSKECAIAYAIAVFKEN